MDNIVKTDAEAWNFLIEMGGEFRIHTNRDGLRVYICICDRKYSGYCKAFEYRWDLSKPIDKNALSGRPAYINKKAIKELTTGYNGTHTGKTLTEAVNKHIIDMPGDVHIKADDELDIKDYLCKDKCCVRWTLEFKGSEEEFKKLSLTDE